MTLVLITDAVVLAVLVGITLSRGLERALPFAAFVLLLAPEESQIPLPGLFDLTTHRVVIVTLILLYLVRRERGPSPVGASTPLKWLIVLHIAWCLVSTANSVVPVMSFKKLLHIVFEYYVLYYICVRTIRRTETVHKILQAMVASIFVCSIFGAFEAYTGWSVIGLFPAASYRFEVEPGTIISTWGRGMRAQATYPHAILFGAALALAIPIALYLLGQVKTRRAQVFLWIAILLMFLNIYKTTSRGPWLGLIIAFILLMLLGQNHLRRKGLVIVGLTILVLVARPGVWYSIKNIYLGTLNPESQLASSYEYRYALSDVAHAALARDFTRQLWGYGLESFYDLGLEAELDGKPYRFLSCDSAWMELTVETGYIGLLIVGLALLKPLYSAWRDFRRLPARDRDLSLHFAVSMFVYYFMMVSVAMYAWGQNGYMLWILIAMAMAYGKLLGEVNTVDVRRVNATEGDSERRQVEEVLAHGRA